MKKNIEKSDVEILGQKIVDQLTADEAAITRQIEAVAEELATPEVITRVLNKRELSLQEANEGLIRAKGRVDKIVEVVVRKKPVNKGDLPAFLKNRN